MYHGPEGLREIALRVHRMAATLADALTARGATVRHEAFFDTIVLDVPRGAESVVRARRGAGHQHSQARRRLRGDLVRRTHDASTSSPSSSRAVLGHPHERPVYGGPSVTIPRDLRRTSDYLTHPIWTKHRSETSLMRYMRRLARPRPRARPHDDSARFVHHEAQLRRRDGAR